MIFRSDTVEGQVGLKDEHYLFVIDTGEIYILY